MASWITSVAGTRCDTARLLFLGQALGCTGEGPEGMGSLLFGLFGYQTPKGLFPPEPEHYRGPKLKVAIIGAGLAGMSTAVELLDQGHEVDIYESRSFIGGKVGSFVDKHGNHIEMGLHVFFGCYNNLFRLMKKVGADNNLLVKDHTHTFVNKGGQIGELDFRFPIGAPLHGIRAFLSTNQLQIWFPVLSDIYGISSFILSKLAFTFCEAVKRKKKAGMQRYCDTYDKARNAVALALSPVVRALIDPDGALQDIRNLDSFLERRSLGWVWNFPQFEEGFSDWFLSKGGTRMSIQRMWDPIAYALACDVPGIKRLLPAPWRELEFFNNVYELVGVPVVTVQLRYSGWVTELQDLERSRQLRQAAGLDDLLYTPDADFSCFADLALTSPEDYYTEGQGSLLQCVLTPGDPYMPLPNDEIIARVAKQVFVLFPSSQGLDVTWSSVVKIGQSLYREAPGKDPFRPDQKTPVQNFFLAGSYTKQDYIDSMEGATLSGRQASACICDAGEELVALRKKLAAIESQGQRRDANISDELSLV
ncbi:Zeta-carotene desaturase, chloroplastic/chromoplastic [Morella rubra]|uniref:Zeta-carotene desaturase, chloroplastic/chromoplastic n=1 Tax=Morella rubra TaxID=262757 RepID=A0A6A1UJD1_9ROSI|nr:Zeta-carotene desaturase, chloroplastic/chromoplastic [Morella rubra]